MRALVLAIAASLLTWPAMADTNIAGHWTFEALVEGGCTFGGTAHLERTGENAFKGELTARQSCPTLPEDYLVRQDCSASQLGNQLSVRCRIVEFVNGFESEFYYPDNFTLTIESSARLHGALVSAGRTRPAEWVRDERGIS
ncbi:MAG: hypothetical protein ACX94B_04280 [Henriciella sp.]|nr:hypothetical protein [Hyphomonadaceae bacterium]